MSHHILVVEDDAVTREKLTGYFEREGYRVTAVENGQEMRAVLAEQEVALVMLDINLPGEDGLLLTRELRARGDDFMGDEFLIPPRTQGPRSRRHAGRVGRHGDGRGKPRQRLRRVCP